MCCGFIGMGRETVSNSRHYRRVAEGAGAVALSRTYLLIRRHYGSDARGGQNVPDCRQKLERYYEACGERPQGNSSLCTPSWKGDQANDFIVFDYGL